MVSRKVLVSFSISSTTGPRTWASPDNKEKPSEISFATASAGLDTSFAIHWVCKRRFVRDVMAKADARAVAVRDLRKTGSTTCALP